MSIRWHRPFMLELISSLFYYLVLYVSSQVLINVWGAFSVIFLATYTANIAAHFAGLFLAPEVNDFHDTSVSNIIFLPMNILYSFRACSLFCCCCLLLHRCSLIVMDSRESPFHASFL